MREMYLSDFNWGNKNPVPFERLSVNKSNQVSAEHVMIDRIVFDSDLFERNLHDIDDSWRVIQDPASGRTFEIAEANLHVDPARGYTLELSTYTSSILTNSGNAVEFAENATIHPKQRRLYVASAGNGGTSHLDRDERQYIRETGRFTREVLAQHDRTEAANIVVRGLAFVRDMNRALTHAGITNDARRINKIAANSAGTSFATGLMAELAPGQVSHVYLKGRPNISDISVSKLAYGMLLGEGKRAKTYQQVSQDPWKMSDDLRQMAEDTISIYDFDDYLREQDPVYADLVRKATARHIGRFIRKLFTELKAYAKGPAENDPAVKDTLVALEQQKSAHMVFHSPEHDILLNQHVDAMRFVKTLHELGGTAISNRVEYLTAPGGHADHTWYPTMRAGIENYALQHES